MCYYMLGVVMESADLNIIELLFAMIAIILFLFILIKIFTLPISIAKNKNLESKDIITIRILTWCGLFAGITWFIAFCLALSYKENNQNN